MTLPVNPRAVVYLQTRDKLIKPVELDRLDTLINYADEARYNVIGAVVAEETPFENEPEAWWTTRRNLREGRYDVLVLWDPAQATPITLTRDDLTPEQDTP
jgi:hypothetical protein